jgi:hypothetical protein
MNGETTESGLAKELTLSTKGLENPASLAINDFVLRFGNEEVACSRFEASFLSPRITSLLLNDPTVNEYEIDIDVDDEASPGASVCDCVERIVSLSRNGKLDVNQTNFDLLARIAKSLGNCELSESLMAMKREEGELSSTTAFDRLSTASFLEVSGREEIEYLASHFFEIGRDELKSLSFEDLGKVVRSENLRLSSEDSLLDFLIWLGGESLNLLGCLRSEYLSVRGIDQLLTILSPEELGTELWTSLCRRLRLPLDSSVTDNIGCRFRFPQFPLYPSRPFEGILSHLTTECGGNVHTKGVVSITASSAGGNSPHQIADYTWDGHWESRSESNSWVQVDLKSRGISLTNYTLKSDNDSSHHLLNWSIDGSNDGESWTNLDRRETDDLNGKLIVKSYSCQAVPLATTFFRFIRLTQTGPDSYGCHHLQVSSMELFGYLME